MIKDTQISRLILRNYMQELDNYTHSDVAIAGTGPAGLTAAYYLAHRGYKVALFEKKLSIGGGMWGGGIMFNTIIFQEEARELFEEFEIEYQSQGDGYYSADSILAVTSMGSKAIKAGAKIFNLLSAEDVLTEGNDKVTGLVLNWSAVEIANLHIDPIAVEASYIIDATGHDCHIAHFVQNKLQGKFSTPNGSISGERSMWADAAERFTVEHTGEIFPGLFAAGMSVSAVFGGPRMGPIFGGMLLSGKKAALEIDKRLSSKS